MRGLGLYKPAPAAPVAPEDRGRPPAAERPARPDDLKLIWGVGPVFTLPASMMVLGGEGMLDCPFPTFLIEHEQGLVLVDTGFGVRDVEDPHGRLSRTLLALLAPDLRREMTAIYQIERGTTGILEPAPRNFARGPGF